MPDYFVTVVHLGTGKLQRDLCGRLWYRHYVKARQEAKAYEEKLNGGLTMEWAMDDWLIVTCLPLKQACYRKGFGTFCENRVTPKPTDPILRT